MKAVACWPVADRCTHVNFWDSLTMVITELHVLLERLGLCCTSGNHIQNKVAKQNGHHTLLVMTVNRKLLCDMENQKSWEQIHFHLAKAMNGHNWEVLVTVEMSHESVADILLWRLHSLITSWRRQDCDLPSQRYSAKWVKLIETFTTYNVILSLCSTSCSLLTITAICFDLDVNPGIHLCPGKTGQKSSHHMTGDLSVHLEDSGCSWSE